MKGQVKLSLAVALALASGSVFALGLGTIQVKSGLNQPLDAEIPVIAESPAEVSALTVDLASAEDFERVGLNRSRLTVPIDMAVATNARGQTVIKLTTKEAVREPLLDFLIQANWSKGKVLREYTVLLDPPVTAPAAKGTSATVAPVAEKPAAAPQPLAPSKAPAKAERPQPKPPVAATPQKPAPAPPPPPAPKASPHAANGNDYGPVAAGETLSEIARATRPDEKTNINQMMLALLKANPNAFYQDNINALKRGAILRIPNSDDIRSAASVREAVTLVHTQNDSWSGKAPVSTPTLVAHTGATDAASTKTPKTEAAAVKQERLALVPPQNGKSQTSADRAGAAGGTSKDMADAKAELARTKEALTSREQEATELKSRVKQLEDIGSKDQKLLSMKNSEIADLQNKLKELQAKAAAAPPPAAAVKPAESASKPADTSSAAAANAGKPEQKVTAKDIWGDLSPSDKSAPAKPAASTNAATTPAATTAPASAATAPAASTSPPATVPAATAGTATSMAASSSPSATSPSTSTPTATTTTPSSTASTGGATVTPLPSPSSAPSSAPAPTTTAATSSDSGSPASTTATSMTAPAKSTTAAKISPLEPAGEPFYKNQNVLLGGGAALLLVGLLALMRFMRKPKPFVAPAEADGEFAQTDEEEQRLLDTLQHEPGNTAASLELLRHYYAQGDAARFETTAEQMHAHLLDPGAPEWDEVLAMGAVLVPNNPLFGDAGHAHADDLHAHEHGDEFAYTDPMHTQEFDDAALHTEHAAHASPDAAFEYDLPAHVDAAREEITSHDQTLPDFSLQSEPHHAEERAVEHDFHMEQHLPEHAPEHVEDHAAPHVEPVAEPAPRSDELFVGEDAIGTKLDLAKAYLDMGDPEGARSMLDEVMSEGDDRQKDEARKLLAEIR